jgi:hypothetical protein
MAALQMIEPRAHAVTLGASKAYDTGLRERTALDAGHTALGGRSQGRPSAD